MTHRRLKRAFTLFEVLLALSLALMLLVAMLTFYRQAVDVRAAVLKEVELVAAERAVMDMVTEELRGAFVFQFLGQGMDGSATEMRFASVTLPGGGVWLVQGVTETEGLPPERDLQIVGYRLRYSEDETGEPVVDGLERTCQKSLTPREAEEGDQIQASLLTPLIRFIRFGFWDGSAWVEGWSGGDLPQAVEVVLGTEPLPEGVEPLEYPYSTFRRVVYVPAAAQAARGTVVRGLSESGGR